MHNGRILVIEDNEYNMKLVRSLLTIGGYEIVEAFSAENGLGLMKIEPPDLVLMDIQLPGMDGLSATGKIKEEPELKNIPVIALTAYAMEGDEIKAINAGCDGYISKPIDTKKFLKYIEKFMPESDNVDEADCKEITREVPEKLDKEIFFKSRILIADDDHLNVKLMKAKLSQNAFVTMEAYEGFTCLEMAAKEHPDLILLDIMMPGLNGYEVTQSLKANPGTRNIPIIHVTALNSAQDKAMSIEAGADEFINKPINTQELVTRIRSLLRLKKYQEQLHTRKTCRAHFIAEEKKDLHLEDLDLKASVLMVDTNKNDIGFMKETLKDYCRKFQSTSSGKEALHIAEYEDIDIVMLDIPLFEIDGHQVCSKLKKLERTRNIQIVTLTSIDDLKNKIKSIELGTDDYLVKPVDKNELKARIRALIRKKAYLDILVSKYESAFNLAITDPLTRLYNHSFFTHYLDLEMRRALRQKHPISLLILDIDDFKAVNDNFGHQKGDSVLIELASIFRKSVREIDVCARYGGEEFAIILPYTGNDTAITIGQRILFNVKNPENDKESIVKELNITVSIGIATCPDHAAGSAELIQKADQAMYSAKNNGKDQVCALKNS